MKSTIATLFLAASLHAAITGTLIDESGKPVVGATVRVYAAEDSRTLRSRLLRGGETAVVTSANSADNGVFRLDVPKTPLADLVIDASGKVPFIVEASDGENLNLVVLHAKPAQKARFVAGGKAVANATVGVGPLTLHSDAEGFVELPEASGVASEMFVTHPDYAPSRVFLGEDTSQEDVRLSRGVTVRGHVVADGQPVANVTITIGGWPLAQSAADGSFSIAHAPSNWRTMIASDASRGGSATNIGARSYDLRLKPAATVSGSSIAGTRIAVSFSADRLEGELLLPDAAGKFVSPPLPPGRYHLASMRRGYDSDGAEITLKEGSGATKNFAPKPMARVRGRIVGEDKQPVPDAFVWIGFFGRAPHYDLIVTGKNGEFDLQRTSSTAAIYAIKSGYAAGTSGPLSVGKNDVTITLPRGFPLQVHVIDRQRRDVSKAVVTTMESRADDRPAARVIAACEEPLRRNCNITSDDGLIKLRVTEGRYDVRVSGPSIVAKMALQTLTAKSSPLTVEVDRGVEVSGRVIYSDNTPVSGAIVSTRPFSGSTNIRTEEDGTFVLRNVHPGKTVLAANVPEQQIESAPAEVDAPARNVTLTIPAPGRLEGRVTDRAGRQPITDFQIGVGNARGGSRPLVFHSDDGSFVLDHLRPGQIRLAVSAAGYAPGSVADLMVEEGKTIRDVEVQLDRGGLLRGRVTAAGQPVSGVSVRSQGMSMGASAAVSDDNGEYVIDSIATGDRTIVFSKEAYLTKQKNVDVASGEETRLDVELDRGKELHGRVADKGGHPVSGVRVMVTSSGMGGGGGRPVMTDPEGAFTIEGLADGRYSLIANKEGYVTGHVNDVAVPATAPLTITLDTGGTISGRVNGLSESELAVTDISASGGGGNAHTRPNSDGTFVLRGVPDGHVGVVAFARGVTMRQSLPKFVDVVNGSAPSVEIDFAEGITISGHVTRGGIPVSNGNINFTGGEKMPRGAPVSADGRYELGGLTAGDYDVSVYGFGGVIYRGKYSVTGNSVYDIQIQGAMLRGHVVDASSGAPIAEANVSISPTKDYPVSRRAATDSEGRFALDVIPDGTYTVHIASQQHYVAANPSVTVSGGTAPDIEVRLERGEATAFHVVDAQSGAPIDAYISVSDGKTTVGSSGGVRDEDDALRVYLAPGNYKAYVSARGYVNQTRDFSAPAADVRVALSPAGRLLLIASRTTRVRMVPASGNPNEVRGAIARPNGMTIDNLAPGNYTLEVLAEDGKTVVKRLPATVIPGQTTTVNVD